MQPLNVIRFNGCEVKRWSDDYLETVFPDGRICPALFSYGPEAHADAQRLGYGDNVRLMHLHHDIAHTFLAEALGLPYSPVIHRVATGTDVPADVRALEEGRVMAFQTYVMTTRTHELLTVFGPRLPRLARQFQRLIHGITTTASPQPMSPQVTTTLGEQRGATRE